MRSRGLSCPASAFLKQIPFVDDPSCLELGPLQGSWRYQLDGGANSNLALDAKLHLFLEVLEDFRVGSGLRSDGRGIFGLDGEFVHYLLSGDDDAEFSSEALHGAKDLFDGAGIDIFPPDDEHIIDPSINPLGKAGVRATAGARLIRPEREIPGPESDHGLGSAFQVRVDWHSLRAEGDRLLGVRVH